jgi:hypothetical protein
MQSTVKQINSRNTELEELIIFFNANLRTNYTIEKYNWQYRSHPLSNLYLLTCDEGIICSQGMIYFPLMFKGIKINSVKSESSFLLPEYRGNSNFENLYFHSINDCIKNDINIFWGFTALGLLWEKKLGFQVFDVFCETQYFLSSRIEFLSVIKRKNSISQKLKDLNRLVFKCISANKNLNLKIQTIDFDTSIEFIDQLNKKWITENPDLISLSNDSSFLRFRVKDNPALHYTFHSITEGNQPIGYFILNQENKKTLYMVDIVITNSSITDTTVLEIISWIKRNYKHQRLSYLGNSKNRYNTLISSLLEKQGAQTKLIQDMQFVLKVTDAKINLKINQLTLNGLWTEGFKI